MVRERGGRVHVVSRVGGLCTVGFSVSVGLYWFWFRDSDFLNGWRFF